jgi:hypothetical protein
MPPKAAVKAPAGKPSGHPRPKLSKSLREVYDEACREHCAHPNSNFLKLLPDKPSVGLSLDVLDLSRNYIGDRGLIPVLTVVQRSHAVSTLLLMENGLRNAAVKALCATLARHPTINKINLSDNYISEGAGKALEALVRSNTKIVELEINNTKIDVDLRLRIKEVVAHNASMAATTAAAAATTTAAAHPSRR